MLGDKAAGDKAAGKKPAGDKAAGDKATGDKATGEDSCFVGVVLGDQKDHEPSLESATVYSSTAAAWRGPSCNWD